MGDGVEQEKDVSEGSSVDPESMDDNIEQDPTPGLSSVDKERQYKVRLLGPRWADL